MAFTVALDGPAAAGKGTIARAIAAEFGFAHLDTGLLYRAVGLKTLSGTDAEEAALNLSEADLLVDGLRGAEAAQAASKVAAVPQVRAALLDFQRAFARRAGGAVLDGRDIGTVICPDAEVKLFVTAAREIRARRRYDEFISQGQDIEYEVVLADVTARDARDAGRADAPMKAAEDAAIFDTTSLDIDTAIAQAIDLVRHAYV